MPAVTGNVIACCFTVIVEHEQLLGLWHEKRRIANFGTVKIHK